MSNPLDAQSAQARRIAKDIEDLLDPAARAAIARNVAEHGKAWMTQPKQTVIERARRFIVKTPAQRVKALEAKRMSFDEKVQIVVVAYGLARIAANAFEFAATVHFSAGAGGREATADAGAAALRYETTLSKVLERFAPSPGIDDDMEDLDAIFDIGEDAEDEELSF